MIKEVKLEVNHLGYVKKMILDGEEIKINSLCASNEQEHSPFLVYLNYVLERIKEEDLYIINKEILRFGGTKLNSLAEVKRIKRRLGNALLFGREVLYYVKYISKFPYDKNYLLLSEVITLIFNYIESSLKKRGYEINLKKQVAIFEVIEIKNDEDLLHIEKKIDNNFVEKLLPSAKLKIQWFLGKEYQGKYYLIANDFITDLTIEKVEKIIETLDFKNIFNYYKRPNFLINLFENFDWSKKLFYNFDLPWLFTDFFVIKKIN